MSDRLMPIWCAAADLREVELDQIGEIFRDVLHHLPMPNVELARQIGVSQPAVSRWATGKNHASLEHMCEAIRAINAQLAATQERLYRAEALICMASEAMTLHQQNGTGDAKRLADLRAELREALAALPTTTDESEESETAEDVAA